MLKLAEQIRPFSATGFVILNWVENYTDVDQYSGRYNKFPGRKTNRKHIDQDWEIAIQAIDRMMQDDGYSDIDYIDKNIELLASTINATSDEIELLNVLIRKELDRDDFEDYCDKLISDFNLSSVKALSLLCDLDASTIKETTKASSPLKKSGIISYTSSSRFQKEFDIELNSVIINLLSNPIDSIDEFLERLAIRSDAPQTTLEDFSYLDKDLSITKSLLTEAVEHNHSAVNILIYGQPGTGKTEFAKMLTAHLGYKLFKISEENDVETSSREDRLSALSLCQKITQKTKKTALLFDEMEDVEFSHDKYYSRSAPSKVFMNNLIENNKTPVIWISNSFCNFDPAFLRRFTYSFEMKTPPIKVRRKIWNRIHDKHLPNLPIESIKHLTDNYNIPPAFIDSAMRTVKIIKGEETDLSHILKRQSELCSARKPSKPNIIKFKTELINTKSDLVDITQKLLASDNKGFSLCVSGEPGTGKSAYGRYLSKCLDMPVLQKRASDLLGSFVGETERNIAKAFEEAADTQAFLIFDEADSLLSNRKDAVRQWEVSQVNEMLTHMEVHPMPFLATTNLIMKLDPASLRRFTFKLTFKSLDETHIMKAFKSFYGHEAPISIMKLHNLTPGDFYNVKKRCDILGIDAASDISKELIAESRAKSPMSKAIGFKLS